MEPLFSGEDLSALELKDPEDTGWSSFDFLNITAVFVNSEPTASNYGLWGITTAGGVEHGYVCEINGP